MIRRPPRSTQSRSSAASDVYKRQVQHMARRLGGPVHAGSAELSRVPACRIYIDAVVIDAPPDPALVPDRLDRLMGGQHQDAGSVKIGHADSDSELSAG